MESVDYCKGTEGRLGGWGGGGGVEMKLGQFPLQPLCGVG